MSRQEQREQIGQGVQYLSLYYRELISCSNRAPAFVSGDPVELEPEVENNVGKVDDEKDSSEDEDQDDREGKGEDYDEADDVSDAEEDEEEVEQAETDDQAQPMEIEPEPAEEPTRGGLGLGMPSGNFSNNAAPSFSSSQRGGIGSARGGIGSSSLPSAFGTAAASSSKPSFASATPTYQPPQPVSVADRAAFSKYEGSIGAKMMAKMGYQAVRLSI